MINAEGCDSKLPDNSLANNKLTLGGGERRGEVVVEKEREREEKKREESVVIPFS